MRFMRSMIAAPILVLSLLAVAASAAPAADWDLQIAYTMPSGPGSVWSHSAGNCLIFTGGWSKVSTPRFVGHVREPRGQLDIARRSGETIVPGQAIHVDRIFGPRPRALAATDVGIQLAGRRAYLTGTIRPVHSNSARTAPRVRLAQLHGVKVATRTVHGHLVATVRGRATMLAPLTGMLNGLRCKGPRIDEHPIPAGSPLGTVTATFVPGRASAAVDSFGFALSLDGTAYGPQPPHIEPTGGAKGDADGLTFATAPGSRVAATCTPDRCDPRDGHVALVGGLDFVDGARRLSVAGLTLDIAGGRPTIRGTVDGTPLTVVSVASDENTPRIDDQLRAQLVATFGDPELGGFVGSLRLPLSDLAPT
ncbi:MAG TPA: hypothetical protein VGO48_07355 [Conexibacter sp.]|jgi:hypothetical protein|nr:hypothetical protein [Conexibacter sp.]